MKKILSLSLIVIAVLVLSACGGAAREFSASPPPQDTPQELFAMEQPAPGSGSAEDATTNAASGGGGVAPVSVERLVIQNANISIVVADVEARMKNIQIMAQQMGGFVVSSNMYQSYASNNLEVPEAQVVIRVPSEKLEEAMDQIKKDVVSVENETRSGQDVTAEYVDLKSRLTNLQAAEAQLSKIMETATETEDVVNIFNQLVYYREQIEIVKGQIKYYEEAAALSAITVTIIAEEKDQPIEIGGWEPKGVARDAIQDLIYFYQDFVDFVIRFVVYTLPVWITVGVPLYLIFIGTRGLFRRLRGNKEKTEIQPEAEQGKK